MAGAVSKAFSVIRLLRRTPTSLSLTDIARSVKIAPSTAHSILNELMAQGAVLQDGGRRYRLGPATFYLGAAYVRNVPIYRGVWSELVELSREIGLTAVIAVPWEHHHLILNVHSNGAPGVEVAFGGRVPIDAGAWGKAYFAWSGEEIPKELIRHTPKSITDPARYRAEVEQARERGYSFDEEEFVLGGSAVASAVTSENGFEGIAALIGPVRSMAEIGSAEAGRRIAGVAARGSYALGDHSRVQIVGVE
jgi:IclR family transcriptional regulator, acetate operon repressor